MRDLASHLLELGLSGDWKILVSHFNWTKPSQKALSSCKWYYAPLGGLNNQNLKKHLPDLQFIIRNRISLVTPPNSNDRTQPSIYFQRECADHRFRALFRNHNRIINRGIFLLCTVFDTASSAAPHSPVSMDAGIEPRIIVSTISDSIKISAAHPDLGHLWLIAAQKAMKKSF